MHFKSLITEGNFSPIHNNTRAGRTRGAKGARGATGPPQNFPHWINWVFHKVLYPIKVLYYWPLQIFVASAGPGL